jgi:antitoxin (DNA-binding transcriptional repressor) of toxin-antitoxin stability system
LHRNQTIKLAQHGKTVAQIHPSPQAMPLEQFSKLWRQRPKLGEAAAEDVANAIRDHRRAECAS